MSLNISFTLNGKPVSATVTPSLNAADLLSENFQLGSIRQCCKQGICGVCTIDLGGKAVSSCLLLSPLLDGQEVTTVEGLAEDVAGLDPVQRAFLEEDALQCGFCTPGMMMMTRALLADHPQPAEKQIREYMAGNICRCGCYPEILRAIQAAADQSNKP
jgi:aerobic-type carbon monoxide dehydrogenase small subunit (CoxS/CutS family)